MTRLDRWPRVYKNQLLEPQTDEPLADFDETVSAELDSTRRGMRALVDRGHHGGVEVINMQMKMVDALTEEVKELRHELAKVVQTLNHKASKGDLARKTDAMSGSIDKRFDTIRNWMLLGIALVGGLVAYLKR